MIPFLDKIAKRLLDKYPKGMDNISVVLPSKRAVVFLKNYLSKRIESPVFLPKFYSIEEFVEEISGLKVLDNLSLQFYLYQAYSKNPVKDKESFDDFLNWSNVLLHDFNEVDRNLVNPKDIFSNLKEVKELDSWNISDWSLSEDPLTQEQESFVDFFQKMFLWYSDFQEILLKNNFAYQGLAYKVASKKIISNSVQWEKVWFVGLNALTKSEQKLIEYLKQEDIARVFWDADQYYYDNPMHEAGGFLREQREKWSEIDFDGVGNYFAEKKEKFQIIACPKNVSQTKALSKILSEFSVEDLTQSNTAIILADEGLLYPVLHNLPKNIKELNVTMGSPLKYTPFYSLVESIFTMNVNAFTYKKKAFYFKDVLNVIELPILSKILNSENLINLKNYITQHNLVFITEKNIKNHLKDDSERVEAIFQIWDNSETALQSTQKIISFFRESLKGAKSTIETEIIFTFYKCINQLQNLISESKQIPELKTLQKIVKQIVSNEVIPFKGEPLNGVQLMGILESRTLDFKNIIILSVNEGNLPKGKSVNSFIPYDLKKHFQLPTYAESDAVFAYHFYRILQRANNISLLYNTETDDFGSGEKSRFITQLLSEYPNKITEFIYNAEDLIVSQKHQIIIENKGLDSEIQKWFSNGVSPSALNMFSKCSLSFYFNYLVKVKKEKSVEEFAEASSMGTAIHESFKNNYLKGKISVKDVENVKSKVINSLKHEFEQATSSQNMHEGKNYLTLQIARKLTNDFLNHEIEYLKEAAKKNINLEILESEKIYKHLINLTGQDVLLKGQVDRIDIFGDTLRIIDYKTGSVIKSEVSFWEWEDLIDNPKKGKAFQLMMYAYLYLKNNPQYLDNKVIAGNFSFKNIKEGLLTVAEYINTQRKETIYIDRKILDKFEKQIEEQLLRIMQDDFIQTDDVKTCEWCDFKSICNR